MKIATYNVNGVNGRLPVLLRWLAEAEPDIVVLQELKAPQSNFPAAAMRDLGYDAIWHGQKSWNGVAILSRVGSIHETRRGLPDDPDPSQSRYIEAAVNGILIGGLYLPNGNPRPGPKFDYKLAWFERLIAHGGELMASGLPVMLLGDFNIMPTDLDVYKPERWRDDALFAPEVRDAYARLLAQGWTDALRTSIPARRSTPSGIICAVPMAAMLGCASTICCSARRWPRGSLRLKSMPMCAVGKRPAIMRRCGSSWAKRRKPGAGPRPRALDLPGYRKTSQAAKIVPFTFL